MYRLVFLLLLVIDSLYAAQTQAQEDIKKINIATINTLLIFTSQKGLNSGSYTFTNTPRDIDMDIYHLPFHYPFPSKNNFQYFIVGNVGYSKVSLSDSSKSTSDSTIVNAFNEINTYTMGVGGGLTYKYNDEVAISSGLELIYSRAGISLKKNKNNVGDIVENFFNENHSQNLTYKFFTSIEYKTKIMDYKPYFSLSYNLYDTKSNLTFSDAVAFKSASNVLSFNLGVESPKLFSLGKDMYLTIETYIQGHRLAGVVKEIVDVSRYGSFGGVSYLYLSDEPWWVSRLFLELNKVEGDGIHGYNVGVGFTLDF